jgi:NodT family efflux transporter outer membrane factor (OMF) lipoprotein
MCGKITEFFHMYSIVFLFVLIFFTSCTSSYSYKQKYKPDTNIDLSESLSLARQSGDFDSCPTLESRWWLEFEDEQLNSLIDRALSCNPSLDSAREKINLANQEALIKKASLFPTIQGILQNLMTYQQDKSLSVLHDRHTDHLTSLEFDFNYDLDIFSKNRSSYEALVGIENMRRAEYSQSVLMITSSICQSYFNLQANMLKLEILLEVLSKRSRNLELISLRQKHRIDNSLLVNNAVVSVSTIEKQAAVLKEQLVLGRNLLNILIGASPGNDLQIDSSFRLVKKPIALPEFVGSDLLAHRPDLTAMRYKIYSLAKKVGVAKAEFLPNINLALGGGLKSLKYSDFFTSKSFVGSLLPSISQPIFTGGLLKASLRANIAQLKVVNYEFKDSLLKATKEVVDSIERVQTTFETIKYQEQETAATKRTYNLVYSRYKNGIDSMISVLSKNEDYLMKRLDQITLENQQLQNKIELIKSIGGGYESS